MSDETQSTNQEPSPGLTGTGAPPVQRPHLDHDSIDLALRFLVGLLALGGDEAARRLQEMQHRLDADPALWNAGTPPERKAFRRRAWHLGVGLVRRGQKRLRRGIRRGYDLSQRALDGLSSTSLTRPVRRPIEAQVLRWRRQAALLEQEGALEEQKGRALATGTLVTLIQDLMDELSKNP